MRTKALCRSSSSSSSLLFIINKHQHLHWTWPSKDGRKGGQWGRRAGLREQNMYEWLCKRRKRKNVKCKKTKMKTGQCYSAACCLPESPLRDGKVFLITSKKNDMVLLLQTNNYCFFAGVIALPLWITFRLEGWQKQSSPAAPGSAFSVWALQITASQSPFLSAPLVLSE